MNKQEIEKAIETIKSWGVNDYDTDIDKAFRLAISALEHQLTNGWIPCIEKYPEECERVIVWDTLNNRIAIAYFSCPHWEADDGRINVIAWQPLPEPYKNVSDAERN